MYKIEYAGEPTGWHWRETPGHHDYRNMEEAIEAAERLEKSHREIYSYRVVGRGRVHDSFGPIFEHVKEDHS